LRADFSDEDIVMRILIIAAVAALASACASQGSIYQSRSDGDRYGYAEMQLEPNRLRVSYNGDTLTSRETVDTYLLYRAAEATLERGFDYFVIATHDIDATTRYDALAGGRPRLAGASFREVTSHTAMADIIMFEGPETPALANVFNARAVKQSLDPHIQRPAAG
jgi:hypothetical protein